MFIIQSLNTADKILILNLKYQVLTHGDGSHLLTAISNTIAKNTGSQQDKLLGLISFVVKCSM